MWKSELSLPELGLIAGTRAMLGAGVGLLLGNKLEASRRKKVGLALLLVGAVSTIPLAMDVYRKHR